MSSVPTATRRPRTPSAPSARVAQNRARFGRIALAIVVLLMASSYVRPAVDWVNARSAAGAQAQRLDALRATESRLEHEKARLSTERGLTVEARRLGMVREGERAYVVTGLPKH